MLKGGDHHLHHHRCVFEPMQEKREFHVNGQIMHVFNDDGSNDASDLVENLQRSSSLVERAVTILQHLREIMPAERSGKKWSNIVQPFQIIMQAFEKCSLFAHS